MATTNSAIPVKPTTSRPLITTDSNKILLHKLKAPAAPIKPHQTKVYGQLHVPDIYSKAYSKSETDLLLSPAMASKRDKLKLVAEQESKGYALELETPGGFEEVLESAVKESEERKGYWAWMGGK
jgi:hypothetical protein